MHFEVNMVEPQGHTYTHSFLHPHCQCHMPVADMSPSSVGGIPRPPPDKNDLCDARRVAFCAPKRKAPLLRRSRCGLYSKRHYANRTKVLPGQIRQCLDMQGGGEGIERIANLVFPLLVAFQFESLFFNKKVWEFEGFLAVCPILCVSYT